MTLQLEVGKEYRNRKGEEVEIISEEKDDDNTTYIYYDLKGRWYLPSGRLNDHRDTDQDLVEEIIHPQLEPGFYWVTLGPKTHPCEVFQNGDKCCVSIPGSDFMYTLVGKNDDACSISIERVGDRIIPPNLNEG